MNQLYQNFSQLKSAFGLTTFWDFVPSTPSGNLTWKRAISPLLHSRSRPPHKIIKPLSMRENWIVYFMFCPDDRVGSHHLFTLARLRDLGLSVFVVCATSSASRVPDEVQVHADALYWKGLSGYDFSAYTLAIEAVSEYSPGATILILNDSMFGPFSDLRLFMRSAPWDMTGFTASSLNENHIQSYAFIVKDVTTHRLDNLRDVLYFRRAYNNVDPVIWCQETRMARVAHRHMSVGSFLYSDGKTIDDPCLRVPFELLKAGFPFIKRSLLGKMRRFQSPESVLQWLAANEHPLPDT